MEMPTLEEYLLQNNYLSPEQLKFIQIEQKEKDLTLEEILLNSGLVSEVKLLEYRALKWRIPFHNLEGISPDPEIVTLIPEDIVQAKAVLPLKKENNNLILAMADPLNVMIIDEIQNLCKLQIKPILSPKGAILKKLSEYREHYRSSMVEKLLNSIGDQGLMLSQKIGLSIENIEQVAEQSTTIKTVNLIILQALQKRASDIHLELSKRFLHIRYRIDGVLHEMQVIPNHG